MISSIGYNSEDDTRHKKVLIDGVNNDANSEYLDTPSSVLCRIQCILILILYPICCIRYILK